MLAEMLRKIELVARNGITIESINEFFDRAEKTDDKFFI
jgi:hypothetical protein